MQRFKFLNLYIDFARILAAVVGILGLVYAVAMGNVGGFWAFTVAAFLAIFWAFLILVGADILACFKAIEENTRSKTE